ncbi:MAG: dihydrodipicolinate reductase C-terminal domain-containing protein [Ignavibacteria bacterium]|nr:dihydrodipicolinate reductase C-terminal domain-containing protein [Ignavibacteria bacterium]
MKAVILGYGKMGREIETVLNSRGHECIGIITDSGKLNSSAYTDAVCIEFTTPDAFRSNYKMIADNFRAAVAGTTGWLDILGDVKKYFREKNKTLIYASNFSIGVNMFFKINELSAKLISSLAEYDSYILELHHSRKLDSPSGTAKTIGSILKEVLGKEVDIQSIRSGNIPGIHETGFESDVDRIILRHEAFSRKGFAEGAVTAAEWTSELKGVFEFREILEKKFKTILNND